MKLNAHCATHVHFDWHVIKSLLFYDVVYILWTWFFQQKMYTLLINQYFQLKLDKKSEYRCRLKSYDFLKRFEQKRWEYYTIWNSVVFSLGYKTIEEKNII